MEPTNPRRTSVRPPVQPSASLAASDTGDPRGARHRRKPVASTSAAWSTSRANAGGLAARSVSLSNAGLAGGSARGSVATVAGISGAAAAAHAPTAVVIDENGVDVTPLPLALARPVALGPHVPSKSHILHGDVPSLTSVIKARSYVLNHLESATASSWGHSSAVMQKSGGAAGMSFASFGRVSGASSSLDERDEDVISIGSDDSGDDKDEVGSHRISLYSTVERGRHAAAAAKAPDPAEGNDIVHVTLVETETLTFVDIPSVAVSTEFADEADTVRAENARYSELLSSKAGNENFSERSMQTINPAFKSKEAQASAVPLVHAECMVNAWILYDDLTARERSAASRAATSNGRSAPIDMRNLSDPHAANHPSHGSRLDNVNGPRKLGDGSSSILQSRNHAASFADDARSEHNQSVAGRPSGAGSAAASEVFDPRLVLETWKRADKETVPLHKLNQDALRNTLAVMERAIVCNVYDDKLVHYKSLQFSGQGFAQSADGSDGIDVGGVIAPEETLSPEPGDDEIGADRQSDSSPQVSAETDGGRPSDFVASAIDEGEELE
ncbi:WD repeat-containing protein 78, partial [Cladochytrium tenue]